MVRVDFNVPLHQGKIHNTRRISAALPGIRKLLKNGCAVILATHLGRPEGKDPSLSTAVLLPKLRDMLAEDISFVDQWPGYRDWEKGNVYLLENLRFHKGELECDDAWVNDSLENIDVVVMDAFSCAHRKQGSIWGWVNKEYTVPGILFDQEVRALKKIIDHPKLPMMAVVSGAKISTKTKLIEVLLDRVDVLVLGGGIANTLLKAKGYQVGRSLVDNELVDYGNKVLETAKSLKKTIILPTDVCVLGADKNCRTVSVHDIDAEDTICDIGQETLQEIIQHLKGMNTVLWNGPLGLFEDERFKKSTVDLARALADHPGWTVVGGGDTISALDAEGLLSSMNYVSMAGGAFMSYIEQQGLPSVTKLYENKKALEKFL